MRGIAIEPIPYGAHVLCRNFEVRQADPEIANGTACEERSPWRREIGAYQPGDFVRVDPIDGQGQRNLSAIANGPIMEPLKLYLPAGKLTEAEYQTRLDLQFKDAGIGVEQKANRKTSGKT